MDAYPAELCESDSLQRLLERNVRAGRVAVAFAAGSDVATAQVGDSGRTEWAAPVGCIAKLLTAALACTSAKRGHFALDTGVVEILGADVEALRGVNVRHLLEHTHGLDDSLLAPPLRRCGFIDRHELLSRVAALERWAAPGVAYSYGHVGAWLVGAMLERLHDRALGALVRDGLLTPLAIGGTWSDARAAALCAASGAGLALTAEELVRVGLLALKNGGLHAPAAVTPLPGWHPLECGVCLGWKYAGAGWLGHQSVWPGASSYLRVQQRRGLALAVVASEQPATLIALGLFGAWFPELFEQRTRLPPAGQPADNAGAGVYEQAARVVAVRSTPRGLCAEAWERDDRGVRRGTEVRALLVPTRGVLFAQPASELLAYAQPVTGANGAAWLWNGRWVLRRVA
jgi:CubicO group peptidase (beta-lactamase class C family)